jgi:hypothetical protein
MSYNARDESTLSAALGAWCKAMFEEPMVADLMLLFHICRDGACSPSWDSEVLSEYNVSAGTFWQLFSDEIFKEYQRRAFAETSRHPNSPPDVLERLVDAFRSFTASNKLSVAAQGDDVETFSPHFGRGTLKSASELLPGDEPVAIWHPLSKEIETKTKTKTKSLVASHGHPAPIGDEKPLASSQLFSTNFHRDKLMRASESLVKKIAAHVEETIKSAPSHGDIVEVEIGIWLPQGGLFGANFVEGMYAARRICAELKERDFIAEVSHRKGAHIDIVVALSYEDGSTLRSPIPTTADWF